jgi:peptide/nickel transport system permease protein
VLLSPWTARYGVNEQVFDISKGPNQNLPPADFAWFGTDIIGRDVYSRVLYGVRVSLIIGLASAVFSLALGSLIGAVAGLKGGLFDDIVMRVTDVFLAFPFLVALLVVRNMFGAVGWITVIVGEPSSIRFMVFLFAVFGWMGVARVLRAQVLSLKEREFIEAARALGASNARIIVRHLLPNSIGPMLVSLSLGVVGAIVSEATLSLFGYGPDPGTGATSLGLLVAGSKSAVRAGYWWLALYPFAALLVITLCVSFIGDGLRDAFDPKHGGGR